MASFSTAVKITDLDDFISPSQECIKPMKLDQESSHGSAKLDVEGAALQLQFEPDPRSTPETSSNSSSFYQLKSTDRQTAKITLDDCLACSGCLTTAETVLLQHQSCDAFMRMLSSPSSSSRHLVVTVSPQSRAALAHQYSLSLESTLAKLSSLFHTIAGTSVASVRVIDASIASEISLAEAQAEFVQWYSEGGRHKAGGPLLSSECPGFVCYTEKTQPHMVPLLSRVRSPQQVMGVLVPHLIPQPGDALHIAIMPCFDKKLEASRPEFAHGHAAAASADTDVVRDVDLVLSTLELVELMQRHNLALQQLPDAALSPSDARIDEASGRLRGLVDVGASGAYLEHVFRFAAAHLFGVQVHGPLTYRRRGRGGRDDVREIELEVHGHVRLRFAAVYGFGNIQNVVRRVRAAKCEYDYVEVMACPSGCLNGGGQPRAPHPLTPAAHRQRLRHLDRVFHDYDVVQHGADFVRRVYDDVVKDAPGSDAAKRWFHTTFRALPAAAPTAAAAANLW